MSFSKMVPFEPMTEFDSTPLDTSNIKNRIKGTKSESSSSKWYDFGKWQDYFDVIYQAYLKYYQESGLASNGYIYIHGNKVSIEDYCKNQTISGYESFLKSDFDTPADFYASASKKSNVANDILKWCLILAPALGFGHLFATQAVPAIATGVDKVVDKIKDTKVKDVTGVVSDVSNVTDKNDSMNFWEKLKNFFSGDSGLFSGMSATLGGLASELGSSIFNYNQQVKLLDKQNEYNTPKAQMERFVAAGLNPNLVYGLGSNGNQPSSGSVAPADFTTAQRENRMAKLNFMLQSKMAQADISQKMAQTNLLNSQSEGQQLQNQINSSTMQTQINQIEQNYKMSIEQVNNLIEQKKKVIAETKNLNIKNMYENDIQRLTKQKMSLEKDLMELQTKWQPYLYGTGMFRDVSTGLGSLGVGANMFGNFFKGLKLPKDMQKYGDMFSSFSNSTF